jgi:hypothetical protein
MNLKLFLPLAIVMALLAPMLFGFQLRNFVNAQILSSSPFPPQIRVWILSPNEFSAESAIPLTITVRFYYGSAPVSSEISIQNVVSEYSLDNGEWKNIPFVEATANETWSHPLYQQMVHVVNCTYSTTLQGLSEGLHFIKVTVKSDITSDANSSAYFTVLGPAILILSPQNKTYSTQDIPLTFETNTSITWTAYSLDDQANVVTGNTTLTSLADGSHHLVIYAQDRDGKNRTPETIYFTVAQQSEPFPTTLLIAAVATVTISAVALVVYFVYRKSRN